MRKKALILFSFFYSLVGLSQQKMISGYFNNDIVFYSDTTYILEYNIRIASNATLTIQEGTDVRFSPGSSLIIDGNLVCNGGNDKKVMFSSLDLDLQGVGIVISGTKGKRVILENTIFNELLIPITFNDIWYRDEVIIRSNVFKNINSGQAAINVGMFAQVFYEKEAQFIFEKNNFTNNNAIVYFASVEGDNISMKVKNNIFSSNIMFDEENSNPQNAVFSFYYDQREKQNIFDFSENSFINNYIIKKEGKVPCTIGIRGSAEKINLERNFFNAKQPYNTLVHFYQNKSLPLILLTENNKLPSAVSNIHIYKVLVKVDGNWSEWNDTFNKHYEELEIKLILNKESVSTENTSFIVELINDTIFEKEENYSTIENTSDYFHLKYYDIDLEKNVLKLPIFIDSEGFETPEYLLGNIEKYWKIKHDKYVKEIGFEVEKNTSVSKGSFEESNMENVRSNFRFGITTFKFFNNERASNLGYSSSFSYNLKNDLSLFTILSTSTFTIDDKFERLNLIGVGLESKLASYEIINTSLFFKIGITNLSYSRKRIENNTLKLEETENSIFIPLSFSVELSLFKDYSINTTVNYNKSFSENLNDMYSISVGLRKDLR